MTKTIASDTAPSASTEEIHQLFAKLEMLTLQNGYWEVSLFIKEASNLFETMNNNPENNLPIKSSSPSVSL